MADTLVIAVIAIASMIVFAAVVVYNVLRGVRVPRESLAVYFAVLVAAGVAGALAAAVFLFAG